MKKIILILYILAFAPFIVLSKNLSEAKNTKPVLSNLLKEEGIDNYHIPAFLVKLVLSASNEANDIEPLFNGARFINIAVCDNVDKDYTENYKRVFRGLDISSYINLVDIIDNCSRISIKALLNDDYIREIVILIKDKDRFIAMSMTGKIDPASIANAITKLNQTKPDKL